MAPVRMFQTDLLDRVDSPGMAPVRMFQTVLLERDSPGMAPVRMFQTVLLDRVDSPGNHLNSSRCPQHQGVELHEQSESPSAELCGQAA